MIPGTRGWFTIQESVDVIHHDAINGKKAHDPLNDEGKFCEPFTMETKLIEIKTDGNFPNLIPSARGRPAADRPERRRAEGTLGRGARPGPAALLGVGLATPGEPGGKQPVSEITGKCIGEKQTLIIHRVRSRTENTCF